MENSRFFVRAGVDENPELAAGLLLSTSLLGLVIYVWAFWSHRSHINKNIRGPIGCLISIDTSNLISGIITAVGFAGSISDPTIWFSSTTVWLLTRIYGVILHLLTSAWCLRYLYQPQQEARHRYIFSAIFFLICAASPLYVFVSSVAIYILGFITIGFALIVIANFVSVRSSSVAKEKKKKLVMILAMCIFWVVFFPSFVLECLFNSNHDFDVQRIYVNVLFFTNFHLFFNGLLCFIFLKLSSLEENEQQQQQPPWQQPQQHQWQQPQQHQWQQPQQHQWQQPAQQGSENPGFNGSVFAIDTQLNSN